MSKNKLINFIWIIAIILSWVNILLFMAAMGRVAFESEWYYSLLKFQYRSELYYICGAVDLALFCVVVLYHHKKETFKPMLLGLFCFTAQIFMLMWKIKI